MKPGEYVQRLNEVSTKKYGLLQEILAITRKQSETMTEEGVDRLNALIKEKQGIIDKIDKADEEFNVYFQRFKHELNVNSLDEITNSIDGVKELKVIVGNVISLIKEISELEKRNNEEAKKLLDHLGEKIKKINQGKKINTAYNSIPMMRAPSYYIDKKK